MTYGNDMISTLEEPLLRKRWLRPRIEKEGLTERAIILCKLNKSLLESSISVDIHRQKSLYN